MRILHTSDWHLGRLFHRASLLDEQRQVLARIVEVVEEQRVDLVVIAGDLYDRAIPPAEAVELFDSTLLALHRAGAAVVAISGNHDSAVRVGYGDRLLERLGVTVRGDLRRTGEPVIVHPREGGSPVAVYPVPYLDPLATAHLAQADSRSTDPAGTDLTDVDLTGTDRPAESVAAPAATVRRRFTHHDAMSWAMGRIRADLSARPDDMRSVVVAHAFLTGGNPSESERELTVGQVDQVRLDVFDGIDYVALGHLHQGQAFDGDRVAYSGTPLRYSFSEQHHVKAVRLVDLTQDGGLSTTRVPLQVGRSMSTVTGSLDALLTDPGLAEFESAWVRAQLTDRQLPLQAMARLQQRFPFAVEVRHQPDADEGSSADHGPTSADVRVADPLDLSLRFLRDRRGVEADTEERALVAGALTHLAGSSDR